MTEPGVGKPFPLGATLSPGGVNFSLFSKNATAIELLLFAGPEDPEPARIIPFDLRQNRTYHYWHVFVPGVTAGQIYAYRAKGPFEPGKGLRFDPEKVLMDPYGRAVVKPKTYTRRRHVEGETPPRPSKASWPT
jgi:glycogen operon protein